MDGGGIIAQDQQYTKDKGPEFIATPLALCSHICSELFTQLRTKLNRVMTHCSRQSRALFDVSKDKLSSATGETHLRPPNTSLFDCLYCEGFMSHPVCLPCGHSMCKTCIDKLSSGACPKCKETITRHQPGCKPTLMIQNVLKKCFPEWVESCEFREVGNTFANEGDFPLATEWYDKAISTGVKDHRVYGNRSRSYLAVNDLVQALADAEMACTIRPFWKKGHFRRASAFEKLGKWIEAIAAYLLCVYLSKGDDNSIIAKVCQLLDEHMAEFTQYEQSMVPLGYPTYGVKLSKDGVTEHSSLTPTIDKIVELCIGGIAQTNDRYVPDVEAIDMDISEFECSLCTGVIYEPVTVTCGHSFCCSCLRRAFDHSHTCPVCRKVLYEFFQAYSHNFGVVKVDEMLSTIVQFHFPLQYQDRKAQNDAELLRSFRVGTSESEPLPIFVCTRALPGIPCPLHVFEPRYRLMIRRCLESGSRRFGMCPAAIVDGTKHSFADFGTVLYINSVDYTPDGRSLVKTIGERRFRVVRRDVVDGYHLAWVEFVFDERVTDKSKIDALRVLQTEVYSHAKKWLDPLPLSVKDLMMHTACSPLPPIEKIPEVCPNGPMWVWWYVHTVPFSEQQKLDMFTCTSLAHRLLKLRDALPVFPR